MVVQQVPPTFQLRPSYPTSNVESLMVDSLYSCMVPTRILPINFYLRLLRVHFNNQMLFNRHLNICSYRVTQNLAFAIFFIEFEPLRYLNANIQTLINNLFDKFGLFNHILG